MPRIDLGALSIAVALLTGGCATVTGSEMQSVLVSAKDKTGAAVEKAECTLESPKGSWKVVTPGSVMLMRSPEDIQVQCAKVGHVPGLAKLISRAHGGMFANIIFGGGIGALIDHNKGTGYEYPNVVVIIMGETTMIDRRQEIEREQQAAQTQPAVPAPAQTGAPAATRTAAPAPETSSSPNCKPQDSAYGGPARC